MDKLGIQDLKEGLSFVFEATEAVDATTDGFQFRDIGEFVDVAKAAPAAFGNAKNIIPQYADLDDAERAELEAFAEKELSLPVHVEVTEYVKAALKFLLAVSDLAKLFAPKAA